MNAALRYGSEWQKFEFPFRAAVTYTAGTTTAAHLNLWLGYGAQKFQIAGVSVTDYGPGNPAGYPQVTYDGREANAAWRTAADARIDQYRKGNLGRLGRRPGRSSGQRRDGVGRPADQCVQVRRGVRRRPADRRPVRAGSARVTWRSTRARTSTLFNQGALGNNLKWNHWENQIERDTVTYPALQWMRERDLTVRGHNLIWPSWGVHAGRRDTRCRPTRPRCGPG